MILHRQCFNNLNIYSSNTMDITESEFLSDKKFQISGNTAMYRLRANWVPSDLQYMFKATVRTAVSEHKQYVLFVYVRK